MEKMPRVDISGFSGPYENACQTMLARFLNLAKDKTFKQIYPLRNGERKITKTMKYRLMESVDDLNPSGAMWGSTMSHFGYIKMNGYEAWLKYGEEKDRLIFWTPDDKTHFESSEAAFEAGKKLGKELEKAEVP